VIKKRLFIIVLFVLGVLLLFFWSGLGVIPKNIRRNPNQILPPERDLSPRPAQINQTFSSRGEEILALVKADNAPIEFYGVVEDESGKPLKEVVVLWDIIKSGSFAPSLGLALSASGSIVTGNDGRFLVKNESGCSLRIKAFSKAGYHEVSRTVKNFGYGSTPEPHQPDQLKPEKYVMIRDGGTRSIKKEIPLFFDWDGKIKEFSIPLAGKDQKMILTPEIIGFKKDSQDYDWSIKIQMKDAQIIAGKFGDARVAPIDGYVTEIKFRNGLGGQRGSEAHALLYIRTNDNQFGEVIFSAYSDRNINSSTGNLIIRWNPEGGRVFE
jgi:hypothetical protein